MKHYRVTVGDVLQAHEDALVYGGLPGIRSIDLLHSAVGRPYEHRIDYNGAVDVFKRIIYPRRAT